MTRPTKRDLRRDLDDLRGQYGEDGPGVCVVIADAPDRFTVTVEPPDEDPVDSYTEVAIPKHLPPAYRGGVTVIDDEDLAALWDTMPDAVREREREYRREHGEPLPPVLTET
jgi:hypothetical protein